MAFNGREKEQPNFKSLESVLVNSRLQTQNNALYQVIKQLLDKLGDFQDQTNTRISNVESSSSGSGGSGGTGANPNLTYLTAIDESVDLPNSRELIAGTGITFDDSIANERTVSVINDGSGDHVPLATGAEPLEIMSDGAGHVFLVGFTGP